MLTVLAFVVTIVIIVAFHEWGHFLAMRAFGVRVLTFSVGFGPKILRFTDKKGTQWVISAIPLGGYVKPLDCRDDETAADTPGEFSGKPAWQRVITYAAGPVFNFILALLIYWSLMFGYGQNDLLAISGPVTPASAAAQAGFEPGDRIIAAGDAEIQGWSPFISQLILHLGEKPPLDVTVVTPSGARAERALDLSAWAADAEKDPLAALGLHQAVVIGEVMDDSPAQQAGFRRGDQVVSLNGEPVDGWGPWQQAIMDNPRTAMQAGVLRDGETLTLTFTPKSVAHDGKQYGQLGVALGGLYQREFGPVQAVSAALGRFGEQTTVVWASLVKLVTGKLSLDNLGGPITIAQVAGESASVGLASFLALLAYLSITLGVINLLPVPMLDGGWIFFGIIEMIRGRSLSERFLLAAQGIGMTLVISFMLLAIYNDLVRQFS
ncbi:zinc metalloprotease [Alcanivorax hongdengensis A-11-3]|uniref:Zinc metalloprotease n=1 Tax=Alcanivorax hongdengensis A-11-3 TaxID=1177179 RepID=L0WDL0_9GAMM|nr:RIP metalloprotease RseP [Alcanivorax hongdengensis]EKF75111.1 zinc metalloprotease [Alcanivorax hongdengensis A-11-3]